MKAALTLYAPMIYTAPCVIFLMRADALCGHVGGEMEMESFLGPVNGIEPIGECRLGPKNFDMHRWFYVQEPTLERPTCAYQHITYVCIHIC
jgi:hypothetical protein